MPQQLWIEKAKKTHDFHREKKLSNNKWTIAKTAIALRRSKGSVCEDLLIARWLKTHRPQLERFDYAYEALEFIRKKQEEINCEDIE